MSRRQVFRFSRDALTLPHRHQSRLTGDLSSPSRQAEQNGPSSHRQDRAVYNTATVTHNRAYRKPINGLVEIHPRAL
jgi:hypothetical protein